MPLSTLEHALRSARPQNKHISYPGALSLGTRGVHSRYIARTQTHSHVPSGLCARKGTTPPPAGHCPLCPCPWDPWGAALAPVHKVFCAPLLAGDCVHLQRHCMRACGPMLANAPRELYPPLVLHPALHGESVLTTLRAFPWFNLRLRRYWRERLPSQNFKNTSLNRK